MASLSDFSDKQKRYVAVRQNKDGGTRDIVLSIDATADSIIGTGKELFFLGALSSFGSIDTMEFYWPATKSVNAYHEYLCMTHHLTAFD